MRERARYSFRVKEFPGGQPWIYTEPITDDLKVLGKGFLGFELPAGTTIEEAKRIAAFLEKKINSISYRMP